MIGQHAQVLMAVAFAWPCFIMAGRLYAVWRDPMSIDDGRWVKLGVGVFVMEFILTHAGFLLAAYASFGEWGGLIALTVFYYLFARAISRAFQSDMLMNSFLWLIGMRYAGLLIGISGEEARLLSAHTVLALWIYFPMVILSVFLPWPRFGITAEVAAELRDPEMSGTWAEQPHRAIGAGCVYFLLLGLAEIGLMTWLDPDALG